jgi:selenium metabolism protein YedF
MTDKKILNCKGLACPQPVIQTKDFLEEVEAEEVEVVVDNEAACSNVRRFAESQGHKVQVAEDDGLYHVKIFKQKKSEDAAPFEVTCGPEKKDTSMAVHISSDIMGQGDDELGRSLINAYMETLLHFAKDLKHITLVNSGVKLAVEGSPVLAHLKELQSMGVEILACGKCLDHFQLTDKLKAGAVSNMFAIVEAHSKVGKVLRP